MDHPKADDYEVLTFDCYGTLIDWETGILTFLQPLLEEHDAHVIDSFLLEFFSTAEPQAQAEGGSYVKVLQQVLQRLAQRLGFTPTEEALQGFPASIADWPPFPDTTEALGRLAASFDLAIVSNTDTALFAATSDVLGVEFAHVITAEDVGVYKPARQMFDAALAAVGCAPERVLHVAQSLFHDIGPASELGLDTVWIDRNAGAEGAARATDARPSWQYPSLAAFADAILD